ncbi:hypothetical protein NUW58_g1090 [Xylaria curta]|uniref:Uncharacterized protein n=1 Tax=Xylaria curta TaxID=42375 RepID=A0ACC1PMY4_9PEZI|nr:hypothetical protein NUW58_g1090 [Xylaria curta]
MDSASVIASLARISTVGITLSRAISDVVSSVRNAPKEVSSIAKALFDLSFILKELRMVLKDSQNIYRRKLIRRITSSIKRVGRIQGEIEGLLDSTAKPKWIFKKPSVMKLLYVIESHKTGINVILQTIMLAVQLKQLSKKNEKTRIPTYPDENEDEWNDAVLARQLAENMVQMAYHSLQELTSERIAPRSRRGSEDNSCDSKHDKDLQTQQTQSWNTQSFDNATWLYNLVFAPAIEAIAESAGSEPNQESIPENASIQGSRDGSKESTADCSSPITLTVFRDSSTAQLQALTQQPPAPSMVVNELLSEWTTLAEDEIDVVDENKLQGKTPSHKTKFNVKHEVQTIDFKDSIGRKFELPFHLVREWKVISKDMEALIKKLFLDIDVVGPHVQKGHYHLVNSRGKIVLPIAWEHSIKPTESYTMQMLPSDDLPRPVPTSPQEPYAVPRPITSQPGASKPSTAPPACVKNASEPEGPKGKQEAE